MLHLLPNIPSYIYIAGILGATATYVLAPSALGLSSKSKSRKAAQNGYPRGLINYKNECFMNVILQSLAASVKVTEWLLRSSRLSPTQPSLVNILAETVASINRLDLDDNDTDDSKSDCDDATSTTSTSTDFQRDQNEIYAAHFVKRALNSHNWHIESEEHDCHEFFTLLMDVLDEEHNASKISQTSLNYFQPSHLRDVSRSAVKNPFHGYLACQFQCLDCNYKYPLKLESFYVLSLTLPQAKSSMLFSQNDLFSSMSSINLYECLNNYFKAEVISEMKCENCCKSDDSSAAKPDSDEQAKNLRNRSSQQQQQQSTIKRKGLIKRQAIAKLPECLCIQIQRNSWSDQSGEMIKRSTHVKFPVSIKIDNITPNNFSASSNSNASRGFSLKQVGIGALLGGQSNYNKTPKSPTTTSNLVNRGASPLSSPLGSTPSMIQSYELRSAIVHYGSAHSGHFVAFRAPLNNKSVNLAGNTTTTINNLNSGPATNSDDWLQISDSDIKRVKLSTVLNSNVYMLFYDKVSHVGLVSAVDV